jgi:hypothetical protein
MSATLAWDLRRREREVKTDDVGTTTPIIKQSPTTCGNWRTICLAVYNMQGHKGQPASSLVMTVFGAGGPSSALWTARGATRRTWHATTPNSPRYHPRQWTPNHVQLKLILPNARYLLIETSSKGEFNFPFNPHITNWLLVVKIQFGSRVHMPPPPKKKHISDCKRIPTEKLACTSRQPMCVRTVSRKTIFFSM